MTDDGIPTPVERYAPDEPGKTPAPVGVHPPLEAEEN